MDEEQSAVEGTPPLFRSLSYNLPPPHRLGSSSDIRLSRSTRSAIIHRRDASRSSSTLTQLSASLGLEPPSEPSLEAKGGGIEEPDIGITSAKRPVVVAAQLKGKGRKSHTKSEAIVSTYNCKPLQEFALFLPPKVPKAILQSRSSLSEFVLSTANTYLKLWELASELKVLDLRFPPPYLEHLSEDYQFLVRLLSRVFERLENSRSIQELYLPEIVLHSHTQLEEILQPMSEAKPEIGHLLLPIKSSLQKSDVVSFDYKALATLFQKNSIREISLVSSKAAIQEFRNRLQAELKKTSKKGSTIKVNYSSQEMGVAGPAYITELEKQSPMGEPLDPHKLVSSLNVAAESVVAEEEETPPAKRKKLRKERVKEAFSTDCTWSGEAELSTDGPFTSQVWNLERLHDEGIDGSGTTIATLDSGINFTHPAFKNKILAVKNFVAEEMDDIDCAIDSDGHGTHCAGVAAGTSFYCPLSITDPNSPCMEVPPGVAPGAKLVICKVVKTSTGDVDIEAFLSALKWLRDLHKSGTKIDVVSISLASTYYSQQRAQVISDLTTMGVIVVCCASNVGRLRLQPIAFPARLGHVLCIGAHDENGKPTSFSPVGREVDFLAPGDGIWGPGPGTVGPFAMDCASGTSCATPAVAGLVSLVLHAVQRICDRDPKKFQIAGKPLIDFVRNVWVMRELLKEMSSSPGHHSEEIGYGTLNPYRILDRSAEEIMRVINEIIEDE